MSDRPHTTDGLAGEAHSDPESFARLYARLAPGLHAWASLRIHSGMRRHIEPEDLVQDTWWRAYRAFGSFDPSKGSFRKWIFAVARNSLLESIRSLNRRGGGGGEAASFSQVPDEATQVSERASRDERAQKLVEVFGGLNTEDRDLALYCGLEDLGVAEAARRLGIGTEAAKKRWQRLRDRLQPLLADDDAQA